MGGSAAAAAAYLSSHSLWVHKETFASKSENRENTEISLLPMKSSPFTPIWPLLISLMHSSFIVILQLLSTAAAATWLDNKQLSPPLQSADSAFYKLSLSHWLFWWATQAWLHTVSNNMGIFWKLVFFACLNYKQLPPLQSVVWFITSCNFQFLFFEATLHDFKGHAGLIEQKYGILKSYCLLLV